MKKALSIALMATILSTFGTAFAANYDEHFKKELYDGVLSGLFYSMHDSLSRQKFSESSINAYLSALKKRVDRGELEKATWPCLSKMDLEELKTQGDKCFANWTADLIQNSADLTELLK